VGPIPDQMKGDSPTRMLYQPETSRGGLIRINRRRP
jgi:hypothetical protein